MATDLANGGVSIATTPPTFWQTRAAILVITTLVLCFLALMPFASYQLTRIDSVVPALASIDFVANLATAVLLFGQFAVLRSRALLVLASGYLYSGLIVVCYALSYPGAFSPNGVFQIGIQATPWLYIFWRYGFSAAVLGYAWMTPRAGERDEVRTSPTREIWLSVGAVVILVCTLAWSVTAEEPLLPPLLSDVVDFSPWANEMTVGTLVMSSVAFVWLAVRRRSALDLWLAVAMCGMVMEQTLVTAFIHTRYSVGHYFGRGFIVFVSVIVLVVLLSETMELHAKLLRSNRALQRERASKLINISAAISATTHQLRQPLTGICTLSAAAKHLLAQIPPDIPTLDHIQDDIGRSAFHANDVLESMRALFADRAQPYALVNVNELVTDSLRVAQNELEQYGIATTTQLMSDIPPIMGYKSQLEEVVLNLVQNAIDAMESVSIAHRTLTIETKQSDSEKVVISVQDTGPGIEQEMMMNVFEPFTTTKTGGNGLGLAIARMIIERHHGQISITSSPSNGARFEITLPIRMEPESVTMISGRGAGVSAG